MALPKHRSLNTTSPSRSHPGRPKPTSRSLSQPSSLSGTEKSDQTFALNPHRLTPPPAQTSPAVSDAAREAAYDREFRLSPLSEALDKAQDYGITVVSMKRDWNVVF